LTQERRWRICLALRRRTRLINGASESLYFQAAVVGHINVAPQMESHPMVHNEGGLPKAT